MQDHSFCIATVPHTGSHSVVDALHLKFVTPGAYPVRFPCWTHTDNMDWLRTTKATLFTTWRDPLLCAISWKARGTWSESGPVAPAVHSPVRFQELWTNWLELRRTRVMPVIDIRFNPVTRKNNKRGLDLYKAYAERDISYLEDHMPEFVVRVRRLKWENEPLQDWYMK